MSHYLLLLLLTVFLAALGAILMYRPLTTDFSLMLERVQNTVLSMVTSENVQLVYTCG